MGTLNVQGMYEEEVLKIQLEYTLFTNGGKTGGSPLSFLVIKWLKENVMTFNPTPDKMCHIEIQEEVNILNIPSPTEEVTDEKDQFYEKFK